MVALEGVSHSEVVAYLHGALKDGTYSTLHGTYRIGQSDEEWIDFLANAIRGLGSKAWIYREGRDRRYWIVESTARFLSEPFDASGLGISDGCAYVRGFFDADGGMPRHRNARLYFQFCQKDREQLEVVRCLLEKVGVVCGRLHNPSAAADPAYWRFYVRAISHASFMVQIGSWHPRKASAMISRLTSTSTGS